MRVRRGNHGGLLRMTDIDLTDVEQGDTLSIELESGERFERGVVSGSDVAVAQDQYERTYVSLTFEGGFWDQVKDRVDSEVLAIRQDSGYGGSPLEQPRLIGTVWNGEVEEAQTPEYEELGKIAEVDRHD